MSSSTKIRAIYLDNAAATPIDRAVQREVLRATSFYGNPSSFNDQGRKARDELGKARLFTARFIGARPEEIIFTSSGSEANNMAVMCAAFAGPREKKEIITTPIEHPSVLQPVSFLKYEGKSPIFVKIDSAGLVDLSDLEAKLSSKTLLVSVMYANNEIGTIEPIIKISKIIKKFRKDNGTGFPLFHIDACQATEYLDMNINNLGADLMTFNGSKIYGPRGIGVLYVRKGVKLAPYILGGDQEGGLRAGTENLPAILGLAKALSLVNKKEGPRLTKLRDYFFEEIIKILPEIRINGPLGGTRLPNNINISIPNLSSEVLLLELDKYRIYAGSGSACTARSVEPSHVLKAIGVEKRYLEGALRFSLGRQTTQKDIDYLLKTLPKIVDDLKKRYTIK